MIREGDVVKIAATGELGLVVICYDDCAVVQLDDDSKTIVPRKQWLGYEDLEKTDVE